MDVTPKGPASKPREEVLHKIAYLIHKLLHIKILD